MSVSRRQFLHGSAAVVGGVGLAGIVANQAAAKISPTLIGYQNSPSDGHDCAGCGLFVPPDACKIVDGAVSPSGWCRMGRPTGGG
jgi:anaerobic selenocysteine-containing dehydrogenase